MLRIPLTEHVSNTEVLRKMETKKIFILRIIKRKLKILGHNEERRLGEFVTYRQERQTGLVTDLNWMSERGLGKLLRAIIA